MLPTADKVTGPSRTKAPTLLYNQEILDRLRGAVLQQGSQRSVQAVRWRHHHCFLAPTCATPYFKMAPCVDLASRFDLLHF